MSYYIALYSAATNVNDAQGDERLPGASEFLIIKFSGHSSIFFK